MFFRCLFFNTFGSTGARTDSFGIVLGTLFEAIGAGDFVRVEDTVGVIDTVGQAVTGKIFDVSVEDLFGVGEVVIGKIFGKVGGGFGDVVSVEDIVVVVDIVGEVVVGKIFGTIFGTVGVYVEDFDDFKDKGFNFLAAEATEATEGSVEELCSDSFRFCEGTSLGSVTTLVFLATCIALLFLPTKALDNNVSWMVGIEGIFLLRIFTAGAVGEETLLVSRDFSCEIISSIVGSLTENTFLRASLGMVIYGYVNGIWFFEKNVAKKKKKKKRRSQSQGNAK